MILFSVLTACQYCINNCNWIFQFILFSLGLPEGWELVQSKQYGTYYVKSVSILCTMCMFLISTHVYMHVFTHVYKYWYVRYIMYHLSPYSHNNCTALYQHPIYSRPPPPSYYHSVQCEEEEGSKDRKGPIRSHSHRYYFPSLINIYPWLGQCLCTMDTCYTCYTCIKCMICYKKMYFIKFFKFL